MLYLTLIRHAPTSLNKEGVFMGTLDTPALEEELLKIKNGEYKTITEQTYDICYCSPLQRAHSTAKGLFLDKIQIILDPSLLEKNLGTWSGLNKKEIRDKYPANFLSTGILNPNFTPPEGESIDEMIGRVKSFLDKIERIYQESGSLNLKVVAVTHNGVIRVIRHLTQSISIEETFLINEEHIAPINFVFDKKWSIM